MCNEKKEKNARYFDIGTGSTPGPLLANVPKPQQYLPHRKERERERKWR
jgi:hypothetical protein